MFLPALFSRGGAGARQIATASRMPFGSTGGGKFASARSRHFARASINGGLRIAFPNWYVNDSFIETGAGGAATWTAAIEYPIGVTSTPVTWGGESSCTIADGQTGALSDPIGVAIPRDAAFMVRSFVHFAGSGAAVVSDPLTGTQTTDVDSDNGEFGAVSETSISDQTSAVGAMSGTNAGFFATPILIVAPSTRPAVLIVGDSKSFGSFDAFTGTSGDKGNVARCVGPFFGYTNCGRPAENMTQFLASSTRQQALKPYFSHVICEYGTNDYFGSPTQSALFALYDAIKALFADKKFSVCTTTPIVTSSDSMVSEGGQTPESFSPSIVTNNAAMLANPSRWGAVWDFASVNAATDNAQKWKTNGSPDFLCHEGIHETNTGNIAYLTANVIPQGAIT